MLALAESAAFTRTLVTMWCFQGQYYHVLLEVSEVVALLPAIYDGRAAVSIGQRKQRFTCIDWFHARTERARYQRADTGCDAAHHPGTNTHHVTYNTVTIR